MDSEARELCALIAEIAFVLAGFSVVAMALRSEQGAEWPPAARLRAHALLFASLSPGLLSLLMLGLSAGGMADDVIYRLVSALWLVASTSFSVFSLQLRKLNLELTENHSAFDSASIVLIAALLPMGALLAANAAFLGLFWPVFAAFFYQLLSAANAFYRLMFLGSR
jgi:hypothetical protein